MHLPADQIGDGGPTATIGHVHHCDASNHLEKFAGHVGRGAVPADAISLAFLAPDLVKAAIEGRLPRGIGVTRLRAAPVEWSRQTAMLGLIGRSGPACNNRDARAMNGFADPRDNTGEEARQSQLPCSGDQKPARDPPIGGLIDESPEHSVRMECVVGLRGLEPSPRTLCQTARQVMMRRLLTQYRHLRTASIARAKTRPAKRDCAIM